MFDIFSIDKYVAEIVLSYFKDILGAFKTESVNCLTFSALNRGKVFLDHKNRSGGLLPIPKKVTLFFYTRIQRNAQDRQDEAMQQDNSSFGMPEFFYLLKALIDIKTPSDLEDCYQLFNPRPEKFHKIQNAVFGRSILRDTMIEVRKKIYAYRIVLGEYRKRCLAEFAEEVFENFKQSDSVEMKAIEYILCEKAINGEQEVHEDALDARAIADVAEEDRKKSGGIYYYTFCPVIVSDDVLDNTVKSILLKLIEKESSDASEMLALYEQLKASIQALRSTESDQAFDKDIKSILLQLINKVLSEDSAVLERYKKIQEAITAAKSSKSTEKDLFFRDLITIISLKPLDRYYTDLCKEEVEEGNISYLEKQYEQRFSVAQKLLEHLYHVDSKTYNLIVSKLKEKNIDKPEMPFLKETNPQLFPTMPSA